LGAASFLPQAALAAPDAPRPGKQVIFLPSVYQIGVSVAPSQPQSVPEFPSLDAFIVGLPSAAPQVIVGVYVTDTLALPVVQQPTNQSGYISNAPNQATQFAAAASFGVSALLAHNDLAGQRFYALTEDQIATLILGDGSQQIYRITAQASFQALEPNNPYGELVDLADGVHYSATDLFARFYMTPGQLVFQTCLSRNGQASWGRYFVVAEAIE
jgi:hypothetical protein